MLHSNEYQVFQSNVRQPMTKCITLMCNPPIPLTLSTIFLNFIKGKIKCKLCGAEIEIDQWFNHLVNAPYQGMQANEHHLILNLYYYTDFKVKAIYQDDVPRTNPKSRFLLRLSNFYRKLSEFILLGTPDHPIGEMNLFQNFVSDLSLLEVQLRKFWINFCLALEPIVTSSRIFGP